MIEVKPNNEDVIIKLSKERLRKARSFYFDDDRDVEHEIEIDVLLEHISEELDIIIEEE
jgi:hypothetical protein